MKCTHCAAPATTQCPSCGEAYCGSECLALVGGPVVNPKAHSLAFRSAHFYIESTKLLRALKRDDVFAFLALSHYGQQSAVNPVLFKVEGDWNLMPQYLGLVPDFARLSIWDKFYASMLKLAPSFGAPFTDPTGKHTIVSKSDLIRYYPEMRPYLEMQDKALFLRLYASAIQSAILRVPRSLDSSMAGWRGYSPIAVPNSLSQNLMSYAVGDRITNWGLGSVSLHHSLSSGFANLAATCCMMFIHFPVGFPIFMLTSDKDDTQFPSIPTPWRQMEILLPAGTIFRIGNSMGKLPYQPYNQRASGIQYLIDTREVFIVGIAQSKGYIDAAQRIKMMKTITTKPPTPTPTPTAHDRLYDNVHTLYHQTSPAAAASIVASQTFFPGKTGYAGGGIYFARSPQATERKALSKGVMLAATVLLGNPKTIFDYDPNITFDSLQKEGYDSVFLILPSGEEYVVYSGDQVRNIRYWTPQP